MSLTFSSDPSGPSPLSPAPVSQDPKLLAGDRFFLLLTRNLMPAEKRELSRHFNKIVEFTDVYAEKTHISEVPDCDLLILDLRKREHHQFLELVMDELKLHKEIHVVLLKKKYFFDWSSLMEVIEHTVVNEVPLDINNHEAFFRHLNKTKLKRVENRLTYFFKKILPAIICG